MDPTEMRATRKALGLTQAELAALIGKDRTTISKAETGGGCARDLEVIYILLEVVGVDAAGRIIEWVSTRRGSLDGSNYP